MKRVDIQYGGEHFSIGGRDLDDVKREVTEGLSSGSVYWLEVNSGEGQPRQALLAITPGVPITLSPAHEE